MQGTRDFHPATEAWFEGSVGTPTEVQRLGWKAIEEGKHALLVAPTGSGKTLAAFLSSIDGLSRRDPDAGPGLRTVYISPLKALVYDIERNLRVPLAGIRQVARERGETWQEIRVDVRTGDTPQSERQKQSKRPGEILVTTPESLFLLLGSRARENFRTVDTVIVDEIHALAPTKRGVHMALSLERLSAVAKKDPQRIGLSATARPLAEIAAFLGGDREVEIVDTSAPPKLDLTIRVPVADMENVPPSKEPKPESPLMAQLHSEAETPSMAERGIWPAIYPELVEAIRAHTSTLIFVNSRGLCERLAQRLNDIAEEELVLAHHGSVSHERRAQIEERLKSGKLRALVATSSLELGIDMGAIDLVILVESPGSVARGLQRVGRAGHQVGATSLGYLFPKFRGDLLESAVVVDRMRRGEIEAIGIPKNALDVLAQQIIACCCDRAYTKDELATLVRRAQPYRSLTEAALVSVLDMLTGRFPSTDFADLRPRLRWDRAKDELSARRGTPMVSRMNAGTIPDRGTYPVQLGPDGPRVGDLDEEMVFESRDGDLFVLGATTWRIEEIARDRIIVSPAPGEPGRQPFWRGAGPGRPIELGRAIGAFTRKLGELSAEDGLAWLRAELPLSEHAASNLGGYVREQKDATGTLPTDRSITIERFRDELGDWRVCILSPFGSRIHAPWAIAIEERLSSRNQLDVQLMYTDDGIVLRFADNEELPDPALLLPQPDELEELITQRLGRTALFSSLFRENAVRSLLVTRRRPDQRNPLWAQRLKTRALLATVEHYSDFPIVLETYRQAMSDVFDLEGLTQLLGDIETRQVEVVEVETTSASPFARSLVFAYVATYLYELDAPVAERRAQALTLDQNLLRELLGQEEQRALIDPRALKELEDELAGLDPQYQARDEDELHDLLRRIGDLNEAEVGARCTEDPASWLEKLEEQHRAARISIAGDERWVAAEDAGLFRDACGLDLALELPPAFLEPVEEALRQLVLRYARCHGPFLLKEFAARYGLERTVVSPVFDAMREQGLLVHGELRPEGSESEWCDAEILRRLKRRTLAKLRAEVAPVDADTLARFLPRWHGVVGDGKGELMDALAKLEGAALPWSAYVGEILPRRVRGFTFEALDLASATGEVVWVGRGASGVRDGRIAVYLREHAAALLEVDEDYEPRSEVHAAILQQLREKGASFLTALERAVRPRFDELAPRDFEACLWDLVWDGQVTNDTFQPLRTLGRRAPNASSGRGGRRGWRGVVAGGRWSLVATLLEDTGVVPTPTERTLVRAEVLLERYGVVSREAALAEDFPGGFSPIYRVLRSLEEAGRTRRGWFVEGVGGIQFASPVAIDRLRKARRDPAESHEPECVALPAVDPANPYGTLLPWPERSGKNASPRRIAGAWVGLVDGRLVWYLSASRKAIQLFPSEDERFADDLVLALRTLHGLPRRGRRMLHLEKIDGKPATGSPLLESFLGAGFVRDYQGLVTDPELSGGGGF